MKTQLKVTGTDTFKIGETDDGLNDNGTAPNSKGGTENMYNGLMERLDPELRDQFHIICSRVRKIDPDKKNILWLHDTWDDPESQHLKDPKSLERFDQLVFVSHHQQQTYQMGLGVPYSKGVVITNAIVPIEDVEKDFDGTIRLIYHTTPHRGLEILVPVVEQLIEQTGVDVHLDVFSSFSIYGWNQRDKPYEALFEKIKAHPNMTYHGFQPNDVVREHLKKAHIFAYPSIWPETSCIAALEAMSAGCAVVCPNMGALPETVNKFGLMYPWTEQNRVHANVFANTLYGTIKEIQNMQERMKIQKIFVDNFYNWELTVAQWEGLLKGVLDGKI